MASEAVANGPSSEGLTPAQKLMEQHDHHATVEDVVDEEDVAHPLPSVSKPESSDAAPAASLSEKAAGKQKAEPAPAKKSNVLNTADEELFPALGPVKPRAPAPIAPTWGKKPASVAANGVNGSGLAASNNTSRASTPASAPAGPAIQNMNLPGKHRQQIEFHPSTLTPRQQLKKPLNDIIRDINRRSRAKLEHKAGPSGMVIFEATGPPDAVHQSLKEIANEVGSKVNITLARTLCHSINDR